MKQEDGECIGIDLFNTLITGDVSMTVTGAASDSHHIPCVIFRNEPMKHLETFRKTSHPRNSTEAQGWEKCDVADTLNVFDLGEVRTPTLVCEIEGEMKEQPNNDQVISFDRAAYNQGKNAQFDFSVMDDGSSPTLTSMGPGGVLDTEMTVRRLTPNECAKLQGFPAEWCNIGDWVDEKGKKHKGDADAPKYKALGNSIALPYWKWLCKRISAQYERDATLGSLFDGIGGFDICWAEVNGVENCRWSSEIEPFCVALLKKHFGDEDAGIKGDYDKVMKGQRLQKTTDATEKQPVIFEPGVTSRDSKHYWENGIAPTIRMNPGDNHPCIIEENEK